MGYAVEDFAQSLEKVGLDPAQIAQVLAAWGRSGTYAEWEGGFLFRMRGATGWGAMGSGEIRYLSGWCDTSGWG